MLLAIVGHNFTHFHDGMNKINSMSAFFVIILELTTCSRFTLSIQSRFVVYLWTKKKKMMNSLWTLLGSDCSQIDMHCSGWPGYTGNPILSTVLVIHSVFVLLRTISSPRDSLFWKRLSFSCYDSNVFHRESPISHCDSKCEIGNFRENVKKKWNWTLFWAQSENWVFYPVNKAFLHPCTSIPNLGLAIQTRAFGNWNWE